MAPSPMAELIQQLRGIAIPRDGTGLTDGQLLENFISRHDEAALASLVQRHGPMVWGVCRRLLANHHDAEDAFQAAFLVLVRKARSVRPKEMVANWLYGVAHQTALKARATATIRKGRERQVAQMPEPEDRSQGSADRHQEWHELQPVLDEELSRLPDKYRAAIILCDLEGKTRKEAARQLAVPEGTVAGWVARARVLLARRVARRGVTLSAGALATTLAENVATAGVPDMVASNTIKAASALAAGQAGGLISANVAALTEGVVRAMFLTKLKLATTVLLCIGLVAMGIGWFSYANLATAQTGHREEAQPQNTAPLLEEGASRTPSTLPAEKKDKAFDDDGKAAVQPELRKMDGAWLVLSLVVNGHNVLAKDDGPKTFAVIKAGAMTTMRAGKTLNEAALKIDPTKTPWEIDITFTSGPSKGETLKGVCKLEDDRLTMCYTAGDSERPTDFNSKSGSNRSRIVYQRQKTGIPKDEPDDEQEASRQWLKDTPGTEVSGGYYPVRFESDGPKGELRLMPYQRNTSSLGGLKSNGGYPYIVSIAFTPKVRQQFERIGISDLESHLRGKNVRVRAKVASCWLADGKYPQQRLIVEDISQFDGVDGR